MATFHVEKTGDNKNGNGSPAKPWKTVSYALAQTAADSIIRIGAGEFPETIEITKDVTLIGMGREKTVLRNQSVIVPEETTMILLKGSVRVRLENLGVSGGPFVEAKICERGIFAEDGGAHLEMENCDLFRIGKGFYLRVTAGKLLISNSRIGEPKSGYGTWSHYGIQLIGSQATITNVRISGVGGDKGGDQIDHCINLQDGSFAEITHCAIFGHDVPNANGIRLWDTSSAVISHNLIQGQGKYVAPNHVQAGIQIGKQTDDTASADIHDNVIKGFSTGIASDCFTASRVWGNTLTDNFNSAVWVRASHDLVPDLGGGPQGSPGENIIQGNGSASGFDIVLRGNLTCFARFNDWGTTVPQEVSDRVSITTNPGAPPPILDFLPFKQIPEAEPLDSILLLDQSGSMLDEGKWSSALAAADVFAFASSFVNLDLDQLKLALITFAGTFQEHTHVWQELLPLSSGTTPISSLIETTPETPWSTPMGEGLQQAQQMFAAASSSARRRYIFLLSDGKANSGPPPEDVYPSFEQKINVYSIGFGDDSIDPEMLSKISNATLGDYALTRSTDNLDLKRFFLNSLANPLNLQIILNTREPGVTTFPVNAGEDQMLVLIGWEDISLQLDFDLQAPDGTLIKPDSLPTGVVFRAEAGASFASYTIQNPTAGDWKFANIRQHDGGPAPEICKFVAVDPVLVAQFWLDRGASVMGQSFRLNARLLENGAALDTATVRVEITGPQTSVGALVVEHLAAQNNLVDQINRRLPSGRSIQRSDILHDYRLRRPDRLLPTESQGVGLSRLEHPVAAATASGIFQTSFTPTMEGTYTFEFAVKGKTQSGASFRRTYIVSKYVSFAADPILTQVFVEPQVTPLRGLNVILYKVTLIPIAANGDRMGPFGSARIRIQNNGRNLAADIEDRMDGSYSTFLSLEPGEPLSGISLSLDGVEIPVTQQQAAPKGCLTFWRRWFLPSAP